MTGSNGPQIPAGGKLLGPQQVAITELRIVPALQLAIVNVAGNVPVGAPCLQVVDLQAGRAMLTMVDVRWMRQFSKQLADTADQLEARAGIGSAPSHLDEGD
jgi:hypothetical protein